MKTTTLFVPLLSAAYASAHGFLATWTIAGKAFKGDVPNGPQNPSVVRQISDVSPVKGASNPDLNCGMKAGPAALVANGNPGDTLTFDWRGGDMSFWPHNTGPMLTYMASCGDQTCDEFDSTQAKWFKINQVGRKSDGTWFQADLMKGGVDTVTLPSNIAPGNYLVRHEILGLHLATSKGGAEFYPACTQLKVGGSGTGTPKASELVSFPGGYSDDDPGIFAPGIFDEDTEYVFPGPPVAAFVSGGGGGSGSGDDNGDDNGNTGSGASSAGHGSPTTTSKAPRPTSSSPSSSNTGATSQCKLKKVARSTMAARSVSPRSGSSIADDLASAGSSLDVKYYPRHISRVMRNIAFGNKH